ncbi:protein lethal(2)essential for life-like [Aricia agestis]|uniref:protein lethal(2)essential for life-like n=1 Tax=Aricia agestis TaxID=91739 RepID=UPI001C205281|nr:protein lethal(2)essential for life-like [Aricia agestis]
MALLPYFNNGALLPVEREMFGSDVFKPFRQLVTKELFQPWASLQPFENMFKQMEQLSSIMNNMALREASKISSDSEKFQVNIDVQHFSPEEISVKVGEGFVTVECKHEERRDEHGYVSRQFVRRYALPQGCLPDTVQSQLSSDGVLVITAPKVLPMPSTGERIVPIVQTGPIKKQIESQ